MTEAVGYQVLRSFPGGPTGTYQPGERLGIAAVLPRNAEGLIARRFLRRIGPGQPDVAEERAEWRRLLAPYLAVEAITDAPAGSKLARLTAEAGPLVHEAEALEQRVSAIEARLAIVREIVAGADEHADFATLAETMAELTTLERLQDSLGREARRARVLASEAERQRDIAWSSVEGARSWLLRQLDDTTASLGLAQGTTRWSGCWVALRDHLGHLEPAVA